MNISRTTNIRMKRIPFGTPNNPVLLISTQVLCNSYTSYISHPGVPDTTGDTEVLLITTVRHIQSNSSISSIHILKDIILV